MRLSLFNATIFEWIVLIWSCLSVPFYLLVIAVIIRYRKEVPFNQPFFKLCLSESVADIAIVFIAYPLLSFRVWGWLDWAPLFKHPTRAWFYRMSYYFVTWCFAVPQISGVLILCVNRYISIMHPHKPPWTSQRVALCICLQWLTGLIAAFPFTLQDTYTIEEVNGTTGNVVLHARPPKTFQTIFLLCIFAFIYGVVGTVGGLYFKMFRKMRHHNNERSERNPELVVRKTEWRLALMGFSLFVVLLFYGLFFGLYAVTTKIGNIAARHITNILLYNTGPILSLINPYLLVIFNKKTREKVFHLIGLKSFAIAPTTATNPKNSNTNKDS